VDVRDQGHPAVYILGGVGAHRYRLPLAIVGGVAAAGVATWLLRPGGGLIEPVAVEASAYFSAEELDQADDYRDPQRVLGLAGLGLSTITLVILALRPPARVRRALERAEARPLLGAAAVGASLSLVLLAVRLPLSAVAHDRAVDAGLATQGWIDWLADVAKSGGIGAVMAAGGAALAIAVVRRFPERWWIPSAAGVVVIAAAWLYLSPVLLDPLFNRFEPLPPGPLRSEVLDLAERSGVDVGEVYRVDASRRTTGANAYVGGLGGTKRVVLYDNLIEDFPREEVRSVVAHELGHVKGRDLGRGLLWLAIVAPAGTLLVQRLSERLHDSRGVRPGPAMLPALALSLGIVSFFATSAGNVLSRQVEARADAYALDLTGDPRAAEGLSRRLAVRNIADPDPPRFLHLLFGTHPTTLERIGYAVAREREDGAGGPSFRETRGGS